MKRAVSGIMVTLLLISMLMSAFNIQPVKAAETIYIRADGSIDPPTANITTLDNITYTFTDNINDSIVVERDNIVVDGAGYTLRGTGSGAGIDLSGRSNVTIKNTEIDAFYHGIYLRFSSNNTISGNNITNNNCGIGLRAPSNYNTISGNNIENCGRGIYLGREANWNIINNNKITNGTDGIWFVESLGIPIEDVPSHNVISRNVICDYWDMGIFLWSGVNNAFWGNTISNIGSVGIFIVGTSPAVGNKVYHNNFINNPDDDALDESDRPNYWDDGYPSGGNYWSDYLGVDLYSGPYQNETGSDGIGDTPHLIWTDNRDRYPLMTPYQYHAITLESIGLSKTVVGQGYSLDINVTLENHGDYAETFNVTTYANETIIATITDITLTSGNSTTITLIWNTTGAAKGNYTVSANATMIPGETDTADNTLTDGTILVTIPGDINGDRKVDGKDIAVMSKYFGCRKEQPCYVPNADINRDGKIDGKDIAIASKNFAQIDP